MVITGRMPGQLFKRWPRMVLTEEMFWTGTALSSHSRLASPLLTLSHS